MTVKAQEAEKVTRVVQTQKDKAQRIVDAIEADKAVAKRSLDLAEPELERAKRALDTIESKDIATVKAMKHPPVVIRLIMDCVLLLFQRKTAHVQFDTETNFLKTSWAESLQVSNERIIVK